MVDGMWIYELFLHKLAVFFEHYCTTVQSKCKHDANKAAIMSHYEITSHKYRDTIYDEYFLVISCTHHNTCYHVHLLSNNTMRLRIMDWLKKYKILIIV